MIAVVCAGIVIKDNVVQPLGDDIYELGVHIADVSYFIPPGSALDYEARSRCTSVYLVQRVIPMLPPLLCEQVCIHPCDIFYTLRCNQMLSSLCSCVA